MAYPDLSLDQPMASTRRPWQVLVVGDDLSAMDAETVRRLGDILDRRPDLPYLTVKTEAGPVQVARDFPVHTSNQIDGILSALFADQPAVLAITFPATGHQAAHTATPDAPYATSLGQPLAAIQAACERGDISPEEAIVQIRALF